MLLPFALLALTVLSAPVRTASDPEEKLAEALGRLEFAPEDPALLLEVAEAAHAAGDSDRALWFAELGIGYADGDRSAKAQVAALTELMGSIALPEVGTEEAMEQFGKQLFSLAQTFQRRKLYANAVDLLVRCRGTRFERDAQKKLDKIYGNKKAVEKLVTSGLPIPQKGGKPMDPEKLAKEDAKHSDWDDHYKFETKLYTVLTNTGFELGNDALQALEQINRLYRQVWQYKTRGETMRRAVVHIYKTKEEFQRIEDVQDPGVQGFLSIYENRVAAFDPRSRGGSLADLWETLFHEASHQFTRAVFTGTIPAWFSEGTACYFEGVKILPSGTVRTNLIPQGRLKNLLALMERNNPTLEMVLSYYQPGSYPGSYYPFGWGLVYFIQNYEDENSERIYRPVYRDYLATYQGSAKHDPFDRWKEFFIEKAEVPGIESFEDWRDLWQQWIRELAEIEFGGPEQADVLIERARRQSGHGKLDAALESYEWALRKRPQDIVATFEIAGIQTQLELTDAAVFNLRRVLAKARQQLDLDTEAPGFEGRTWQQLADDCLARLQAIDKNVASGVAEMGAAFSDGMLGAADQLVEAGFPLAAMDLLSDSSAVLGGDGRLEERLIAIGAESEKSVLRWRRLQIDADMQRWRDAEDLKPSPPDAFDVEEQGISSYLYAGDMPGSYRYEAEIEILEKIGTPVVGIAFGANNRTGMRTFVLLPGARSAGIYEFRSEGPEEMHDLGTVRDAKRKVHKFAIEVDGTELKCFLNGKQMGKTLELAPDELEGEVGIVVQGVSASVRGLRVRY